MTVDQSSKMVERVKAAIKSAIDGSEHSLGEDGVDATCLDAASAAIAAMREPTTPMLRAAAKAMSPGLRPVPERVSVRQKHAIRYRAMIDAALPSPKGGERGVKVISWKYMALAVAAIISPAAAADGPPPGFFPEGMSNVATRYETYCLFRQRPCVERRVKEWGQTCHQPFSQNGSPYLDGIVPPRFEYVSWRCDLQNPTAGVLTSGKRE